MMERISGGRDARKAARAGAQLGSRPQQRYAPYAPARPAKPGPLKAIWRIIKTIAIVVGVLGVSGSLLQVADGVMRDRNNGSGFLPDFLRATSYVPLLDHLYGPAPSTMTGETTTEDKPPVAQDAQLSAAQVRYCLSQGIRLQGAGKVVNTSSALEASRFLALADDYNPRCGNYRSAPNVLQSVKAEVEPRRAALELEGALLVRPSYVPPPPVEERPPAAQGALLREPQVRYCLSMGIRLQGAAKAVNTAVAAEASRFLALGDDYSQRCGNYRIAPGVTNSVKDEVETRRTALEREGVAMIHPVR